MSRTPSNQTPGNPGGAPTIAVSMGDPLGIGPEVTVKALADPDLRSRARFLVFGMSGAMQMAADRAGIEPYWWRVRAGSDAAADAEPGDDGPGGVLLIDYTGKRRDGVEADPGLLDGGPKPTKQGGAASFRFVEDSIASAQRPAGSALSSGAIVTAPISKEAWSMAGKSKYPGHTELLASRFNTKRVRMMFVAPKLRTILATAHLPLMDIRNVLTIGRVFDTIDLGWEACRSLGIEQPRVAVCGLNPHAGEAGLLGDEETRVIEPAIKLAREQGMNVSGPFPGDTIWRPALAGRYDLVVAMYHDQGLIPVKLLSFESAVNVTTGLPVTRTSPDHGTAFDIAGQDRADAGSMRAAIDLAIGMSSERASGACVTNPA